MIVDEGSLSHAVCELEERSQVIAELIRTYGHPPAWRRKPGFSSLAYTILEQQVSLASAKAVYERLLELVGGSSEGLPYGSPDRSPDRLTAASFNTISDSQLRSIGFSRQKIEYCRDIATQIETGALDLDALTDATDEKVRATLIAIRGIGPWTADIYLLHSLGRPDIWPTGDLALQIAVQETLRLDERPGATELEPMGDEFRPLRSVAARIFWHGYLSRRGIGEVT